MVDGMMASMRVGRIAGIAIATATLVAGSCSSTSSNARAPATTTTAAPTSTKAPEPSTSGVPPTTNAPTGAVVPPLGRALDLNAGTAFGFDVGGTSPETVIKALTPVLGPPTRDTGVFVTHIPDPEGCFGNQQNRVLRWGNLAYKFWHRGGYVLSAWTLGSTKTWLYPFEWPEPRPAIEQPAIAATTADGIGIGSPLRVVRNRYALQLNAPHRALVGVNPVVSPVTFVFHTDGVVTGIGRESPACA